MVKFDGIFKRSLAKLSDDSLIAFHPSYYVRRYLDTQGMKQSELAKRLNVSEKVVSNLVHGKINLTDELAEGLALVFGTSTALWINLNRIYFEKKRKIEIQFKIKKRLANKQDIVQNTQ